MPSNNLFIFSPKASHPESVALPLAYFREPNPSPIALARTLAVSRAISGPRTQLCCFRWREASVVA
jgi:hypothetical protein